MKIKITKKSYSDVMKLKPYVHKRPSKQSWFFKHLIRFLTRGDMKRFNFKVERIGMDGFDYKRPCLYLMNHSSFTDLKLAFNIIHPNKFHIVTTDDAFIGKNWLMRRIGCVATKKFMNDTSLVKNMVYCIKKLKSSVLMFPEAGYSFDGTKTTLPDSLGKCAKLLGVPVIMITTYGAFLRDPLYNNLQIRKVDIKATLECIISDEDVKSKSVNELQNVILEAFSFDNFKYQQNNLIRINEEFRADFLNRLLYKCPNCGVEGKMEGKGIYLTCNACGKKHELTEYGFLKAIDKETRFNHIPDWYNYEREEVKKELIEGTLKIEALVDIYMIIDTKQVFYVGEGNIIQTNEGIHLVGINSEIDYWHKPKESYTINSDFNWYEIGDMVSIGNMKERYYCVPKNSTDIVCKMRLAQEELYKLNKNNNK